MQRVAIIGGGLSGLVCASMLRARFDVTVFDKARGVGGRTSVRREGTWRFDHGAPRLELGASELTDERARWEAAGVIAAWQPRLGTATTANRATWVGVPGSNALAVYLANDHRVVTKARILSLAQSGDGWRLETDLDGRTTTFGPFELVVVTAPTPQTLELLATANADLLAGALAPAVFAPCIVAMLAIEGTSDCDEIRELDGPLASAHKLDHRPGRTRVDGVELWVAHGGEPWSQARLEDDPDVAATELAIAMRRHVRGTVVHQRGHRWRYARATKRIAAPFAYDPVLRLGVAGDSFAATPSAPAASRAVLSGRALAAHLIATAG
jgi:renalase